MEDLPMICHKMECINFFSANFSFENLGIWVGNCLIYMCLISIWVLGTWWNPASHMVAFRASHFVTNARSGKSVHLVYMYIYIINIYTYMIYIYYMYVDVCKYIVYTLYQWYPNIKPDQSLVYLFLVPTISSAVPVPIACHAILVTVRGLERGHLLCSEEPAQATSYG